MVRTQLLQPKQIHQRTIYLLTAVTYTLRPLRLDESSKNDFIIRHNGRDVGRVYLSKGLGGERWQWAINVLASFRRIEGVPISGLADTLDRALEQFQASFDAMLAAGAEPRTLQVIWPNDAGA